MKTGKTTHQMPNTIDSNPLNETNRQLIKFFSLPIGLVVVMSISLGFVTKPVRAENTGTEDAHPGYRYIKPEGAASTTGSSSQGTKESSAAKETGAKKTNPEEQPKKPNENASAATTDLSIKDSSKEKCAGAEKTTSGDQRSQTDQKIEPVTKPTDGKGVYPTFSQADIDGDHYITKYELKNYPYLLQVFDKVDAGKDGKLEQHEYQNLEMETKREGEIR
jgi:hypothetical protein